MRLFIYLLPVLTGCSSAPIADTLDWFRPGYRAPADDGFDDRRQDDEPPPRMIPRQPKLPNDDSLPPLPPPPNG